MSCQEGGGVAAIIYNNENDNFRGSLTPNTSKVSIAVVSASGVDGTLIIDNHLKKEATIKVVPGYSSSSGTSMVRFL